MRYLELAVTVPVGSAEAYAEALLAAGAGGIEERDATTLLESASGQATLLAWIPPGEAAAFLERLRREAAGLAEPRIELRHQDEEEWREAWKRYFGARRVGSFVLQPSWEPTLPRADEIALALDPGRALGTGGHASTRLCLKSLSALAGRSCTRFLDLGAGSGVLAIASALLWPAARGLALDTDPDAVEVARENADRNRVGARLVCRAGTIAADAGAGGAAEAGFDLITANIEPAVLVPLAAALAARLLAGGVIILSGLLVEAAPPVEAAYVGAGLELQARHDEEGWRALVLAKCR